MRKFLVASAAIAAMVGLSTTAEAHTSFSITIGTPDYGYPGYDYGYGYEAPGYGYYEPYRAAGYGRGYSDDYDVDDYGYYDDAADGYAPAVESQVQYRYSRRRPNYRCGDGTSGTIIGGAGGALIGRAISRGDGRYSRGHGVVGAIVGGAAGALVGREIDRSC